MSGFGIQMLINFAFMAYATRMLGPSSFGIFYSFYTVLLAFNPPINSLQLGVARYTALENCHLKESVKNLSPTLFVFAGAVFVLFALASPILAPAFKLPGVLEVMLGGMMLAVWLLIAGYRGIFQARMDFKSYGINIAVEAVLRGLFGVLFIAVGLGIGGAIGASVASVILAISILLFGNLRYYVRHIREFRFRFQFDFRVAAEFGKALLALLPFGIMLGLDNIVVQLVVGGNDTGYLAICSLIGKSLVTLSLVVANVVFSYSIKHREKTFWVGLALTTVTFLSAWLFIRLTGAWLIQLIWGDKFLEAAKILPLYILFAMPLGIMQNIVNYSVARDSWIGRLLLWIFMALTAAAFTLILHFNRSLDAFLWSGMVIFFVIDAILLAAVMKSGEKEVHG